jgi:hypothetical protein
VVVGGDVIDGVEDGEDKSPDVDGRHDSDAVDVESYT